MVTRVPLAHRMHPYTYATIGLAVSRADIFTVVLISKDLSAISSKMLVFQRPLNKTSIANQEKFNYIIIPALGH